jgi:signal transduction histidine kinase
VQRRLLPWILVRCWRHERECRERTITLTAAIEPGAELALGDPDRLEQALQNLAANALRATPAGGRIDLRAELAPEGVRLSVRDSGPGIPTEHLPFIFDRFYKIDASRAGAAGGSGLGLSIVKAIVERHGGRIAASSAPGAGTLMEITLPSHAPGDRSAAGEAVPSRATDRG